MFPSIGNLGNGSCVTSLCNDPWYSRWTIMRLVFGRLGWMVLMLRPINIRTWRNSCDSVLHDASLFSEQQHPTKAVESSNPDLALAIIFSLLGFVHFARFRIWVLAMVANWTCDALTLAFDWLSEWVSEFYDAFCTVPAILQGYTRNVFDTLWNRTRTSIVMSQLLNHQTTPPYFRCMDFTMNWVISSVFILVSHMERPTSDKGSGLHLWSLI